MRPWGKNAGGALPSSRAVDCCIQGLRLSAPLDRGSRSWNAGCRGHGRSFGPPTAAPVCPSRPDEEVVQPPSLSTCCALQEERADAGLASSRADPSPFRASFSFGRCRLFLTWPLGMRASMSRLER